MKKIVAIIVAVGTILTSRSIAHASDGYLDTTWGGDGVVVSTHSDSSAAYAVANYPDNRVLVVGSVTDAPASRILINRFLIDGTLDATCNSTGEFADTVNDAVASDVVVLSDGSFVVAGTMQINSKGNLFVAKFTSTCEIDGSFGIGNSGFATYSAGGGTSGRALAVQSDGKIVVVGDEYLTESDSSDQRILVTRFTALGNLDNSFGPNGSAGRFISSASEKGQAQDVVIDADGHIVFAGSIVGTIALDAAIVGRLTSNGQLDTTFGDQGYFIDELSGDPQLTSIALRANGNLVAVGSYIEATVGATKSILVLCLDNTGDFDTECAPNGWGYFAASTVDAVTKSVAITEDGFIILGGTTFPISEGPANPFVMRLDHTANPDTSFADDGIWTSSDLNGYIHSVTVQSDGRIIAAGELDTQGTMSVGVVRLANTITVTTTTIPANQLPATGHDENGLMVAVRFFGIGILLMGMRRRALH